MVWNRYMVILNISHLGLPLATRHTGLTSGSKYLSRTKPPTYATLHLTSQDYISTFVQVNEA